MTEEHALLRAILEHPVEDLPRLAYADWLDEHHTPKRAARAEFIRLQVNRTNEDRQHELIRKWGRAWVPRGIRHKLSGYGLYLRSGCWVADAAHGQELVCFERGWVGRADITWCGGMLPTATPAFFAAHMIDMLAVNPVDEFTLRVANHEPELKIKILSWHESGTGWLIFAYTKPSQPPLLSISNPPSPTRKELMKSLPAFIASYLDSLTFREVEQEIPF